MAGIEFKIRELSEDELKAIKRRNREDLAEKLGLSLDVVSDNKAFKAAIRDIEDGQETWASWQAETSALICRQHIKGWDAPRAFSTEAVEKLFPSAKAELAQLIIQKSSMGVAASDFLES